MTIQLYDTTLRDGAQREGVSFSVEDRIRIAQKLDAFGMHFIEGGWPGANPNDTAFFRRMRDVSLEKARLVAFGSTRRAHTRAEDDPNLMDLLATDLQVVTLVGKGSLSHVKQILKTSPEENLAMIADSVRYLKSLGRTVFLDAEHFFDGYKADAAYALETAKAAAGAGVDCIIVCDTNGGTLPSEVFDIVKAVGECGVSIGIHAHNDAELAVANTLAAVQAGATQVQGTINGYGERCGNANLCSIVPTLKLKMGIDCIDSDKLAMVTGLSHHVSEIANLPPDPHLPYVGASAFSHKAGIHIAAMAKAEESYQHIAPALVGNKSHILVSELAGVNTIVYKAKEKGFDFSARKEQARAILEQVKALESQGFKYDTAEASFEVLLYRAQPEYTPPFELVDFMVVVERHRRHPVASDETTLSEATIKVKVKGEIFHTAAEGNGPVNALDAALRKALVQFYPQLNVVKLIDYKVRILQESEGTQARVRVLIESSDGEQVWHTVGSSANIIEASWIALADSMEYWLVKKVSLAA